ncbi:MAG: hypothetical protein ACXVRA_10280 [Gaiellaceae bacterium]
MGNLAALDVWRASVSKHRVGYAFLAAAVATHIATVSGYWYKIIGIPVLGWPQFNGILLLGHTGSSTNGAQQFWAGSVYHFLTGLCFGLIFVFLVHPLIPIRNTFFGNIAKALIWGTILATFSALLWVPRNFPEFHPGFFTNNLGWKTVIGIYIWHLVYGLHLGAFYNPLPEAADQPRAAAAPSPPA